MTFQEFFNERPELLTKLKNCKSEEEFAELAEQNGIKFGNNKLNEVYNFICGENQNSMGISDNVLSEVAGGQSNSSVTSLNVGDKEINLITWSVKSGGLYEW